MQVARHYFALSSAADWDPEILFAVEVYYLRFGCFPNALIAAPAFFQAIEAAWRADPQRYCGTCDERDIGDEPMKLGGLRTPSWSLCLYQRDTIRYPEYLLTVVTDPGDGGEPVPEAEGAEEPEATRARRETAA